MMPQAIMGYDLKSSSTIKVEIGSDTFTLVPKTMPPGCVTRPANPHSWKPCAVVPNDAAGHLARGTATTYPIR